MSDGSYVSSIAAYKPPTYVPDIAAGAPKITALMPDSGNEDSSVVTDSAFAGTLKTYMKELGGADIADAPDDAAKTPEVSSVGNSVKSFFSSVNDKINDADQQTRDLISGKTDDTAKVVASAQEADLSLDMMLALTKRVTAAYQSVQAITI